MKSNNPIHEVFGEASNEFKEDPNFKLILSIGTGRPERGAAWPGVLEILHIALRSMTDTEDGHKKFTDRFAGKYVGDGKPYIRLNGEGDLAEIDLADHRSIGKIEEKARDFIKSEDDRIEECARKLAKGRL
jgi:hypothetical protein